MGSEIEKKSEKESAAMNRRFRQKIAEIRKKIKKELIEIK